MDDCHNYELDTFMAAEKNKPLLTFYQMIGETKIDGVTNEEILKVLIHRLNYLNETWKDGKFKCQENTDALGFLEGALARLEDRTKDRETRGVEGSHNV
jgi:hypothetical protein